MSWPQVLYHWVWIKLLFTQFSEKIKLVDKGLFFLSSFSNFLPFIYLFFQAFSTCCHLSLGSALKGQIQWIWSKSNNWGKNWAQPVFIPWGCVLWDFSAARRRVEYVLSRVLWSCHSSPTRIMSVSFPGHKLITNEGFFVISTVNNPGNKAERMEQVSEGSYT